jgi:hypothetical protein
MVHVGKAQVFKRQVTKLSDGFVDTDFAGFDLL